MRTKIIAFIWGAIAAFIFIYYIEIMYSEKKEVMSADETIIANQNLILKRMDDFHPHHKSRQEIKMKMHDITITDGGL